MSSHNNDRKDSVSPIYSSDSDPAAVEPPVRSDGDMMMETEAQERPGGVVDANLEESEEGEAPRALRDPGMPTDRERREHMLTHIPFRSWCEHCVRGRG